MNYIGAKFKLREFLYSNINDTLQKDSYKPLNGCIFCDLFAGTGIVGRFFKNKVKEVIANDREYYSFVLNQNYIANNEPIFKAKDLFEELNSDELTPLIEGKIYQNYCLGEERFNPSNFQKPDSNSHKRQYFSDYNGAKIDAIVSKIKKWKQEDKINTNTYYYLLASLLESADKVANTASVYGAYLKYLKKSASKNIILSPATFEITPNIHKVYQKDSNELIKEIKGDILYLDPPYNAREYGANYHLLNTIALYDDFIPRGKTGLRDYQTSSFCKKNQVASALEDIIKNAEFNYIFLSYNDEGLLSLEEIKSIFSKYGRYNAISQPYQRFKADSSRIHKQNSTIEYLHVLSK
ncbi:DNA adenine methylase [Helicobacter cappadocius]|uniref:site-specific DNA-methyltransferase (adenine-specific) n=1 Tax=Helicobacter cappadocius TaxID=3063998 RepID=A0AA90PY82_9HELI|nr:MULTISPECIES: DNA adenine methylase [unclassified Helicobacter]MDO7253131.1 DNA adenine methylase [Helicobacter sp. faydin-H75]MDP2538743.1 DNA adenine methylase [Helicobacter sp. faydin-H76]